MIAEFEVQKAVVLEDRSLFALAGSISEGTARAGMYAALEGGEDRFDVRIHGVEFVDLESDDRPDSTVALTFYYSRDDKLEGWQSIDWAGQRLELYWKG